MQVKTITTAAGVNEIDFGNDGSQSTAHFYWFKNLGDSILYVSANPNPIAEKDDVAELPAKGAVSVETDEGKIYVLGAGKVEIHRTNSKFCPFDWQSSGSGGGGTIDAYSKTESDAKYAQKTDIPTSLPANGGNADTVDNKHATDFITGETLRQRTTIDDCTIGGAYAVSPEYTTDMPTQYGHWGICDARVYGLGIFQTIKYTDTAIVICRSKIVGQTEWSDWKEISTTPIKSAEFGITTNEQALVDTGLPVATTKIISVLCSTQSLVGHAWQLDGYSTWFASFYSTSNMATPMPNTPVSFTIYYFKE